MARSSEGGHLAGWRFGTRTWGCGFPWRRMRCFLGVFLFHGAPPHSAFAPGAAPRCRPVARRRPLCCEAASAGLARKLVCPRRADRLWRPRGARCCVSRSPQRLRRVGVAVLLHRCESPERLCVYLSRLSFAPSCGWVRAVGQLGVDGHSGQLRCVESPGDVRTRAEAEHDIHPSFGLLHSTPLFADSNTLNPILSVS